MLHRYCIIIIQIKKKVFFIHSFVAIFVYKFSLCSLLHICARIFNLNLSIMVNVTFFFFFHFVGMTENFRLCSAKWNTLHCIEVYHTLHIRIYMVGSIVYAIPPNLIYLFRYCYTTFSLFAFVFWFFCLAIKILICSYRVWCHHLSKISWV